MRILQKTTLYYLLTALIISVGTISCDEDDEGIDITNISFDGDIINATMVQGSSINLDEALIVLGADADLAVVVFSSSDETVLSLSDNTLSADAVGLSIVTATETTTELSETIEITVVAAEVPEIPISGISLDAEALSIEVGSTGQLTATIAPEDATNSPTVSWTMEMTDAESEAAPSSFATVNEEGSVTGVAACEGCIKAVATIVDGENTFSASAVITIENVPVSGIALDVAELEVDVNRTAQLTATITPANAFNQTVIWSIEFPAVEASAARVSGTKNFANPTDYATIDQDGLVTGVHDNTNVDLVAVATIAEGDHVFTASAIIHVNLVPLTSITISPNITTIINGETQQMTAAVFPENATNTDVTWHIDYENTCISPLGRAAGPAIIDDAGLINTNYHSGCSETVQVYAMGENDVKSNVVEFNVVEPKVEILTITSSSIEIVDGKITLDACYFNYEGLGVTVEPVEAFSNVTWSLETESTSVTIHPDTGVLNFSSSQTFGPIVVTAIANDGSGASDSIEIEKVSLCF